MQNTSNYKESLTVCGFQILVWSLCISISIISNQCFPAPHLIFLNLREFTFSVLTALAYGQERSHMTNDIEKLEKVFCFSCWTERMEGLDTWEGVWLTQQSLPQFKPPKHTSHADEISSFWGAMSAQRAAWFSPQCVRTRLPATKPDQYLRTKPCSKRY